jgi:hypothetical protein
MNQKSEKGPSSSLKLGPSQLDDNLNSEPEKKPNRKELFEKEYGRFIDWRENKYKKDVEKNESQRLNYCNLKVHNEIVLEYAQKIADMEKLPPEEKAAAIVATIMHDSGKLDSNIKDHHIKGVESAEEMLAGMKGQKIEGIEITEDFIIKVKEAIERHMNHPFMVKIINKGQRFPEPINSIDEAVFHADMLANIGFKNIGIRLNENFFKEDEKISLEKGIMVIEEAFNNIMSKEVGVGSIEGAMLTKDPQMLAGRLIESVKRIIEYFKEKNVFKKIQDEFSDNEGKYNLESIAKKGDQEMPGVLLLKKRLNEEIVIAGWELNINSRTVEKFLM